jgi:L-ribulose-5-phosphate 4-epimerase
LTKAGCCSSFTEPGKRLLFVETSQKIDYAAFPAVLVANHGPFCWGPDEEAAAHNAAVFEAVARVAYFTVRINEQAEPVGRTLQNKHYLRKHGSNAYYGQAKESK